jgi:hypothetical protein
MDDANAPDERLPLDDLVALLRDPAFAALHRRRLSLRETSQHANPLMLAVSTADSMYVREWRDHAANCAACGKLFAYFGFD